MQRAALRSASANSATRSACAPQFGKILPVPIRSTDPMILSRSPPCCFSPVGPVGTLRVGRSVPQPIPRSDVRMRAVQTEEKTVQAIGMSGEEEDDRPFDSLSGKKSNEGAWLALYAGLVTGMSTLSFYGFPHLTSYIVTSWNITSPDTTILPVFLSLVSILYALVASNTFLFCYERQTSIIQELYDETYALEMIMLKVFNFNTSDKSIRSNMSSSIRRYIVEEMFYPEEMESPYVCEGAFMEILDKIKEAEMAGNDVTGIIKEMEKLARAQSRRSSVAAGLLPTVHWIFIHSMEATFTVTFLILGAGVTDGAVQIQIAFSVLMGLLTLTGMVLHDMALVSDGLYCFRGPLDERLNYAQRLLRWLDEKPADYVPPRVGTLHYLEMVTSDDGNSSHKFRNLKGKHNRANSD